MFGAHAPAWAYPGEGPLSTTITVVVSPALETDVAVPVIAQGVVPVAPAEETDSAPGVRPEKTVDLGSADESDSAVPLGVEHTHPLGVAGDSDSAPAILRLRRFAAPDASTGLNAQLLFGAFATATKILPDVTPPDGHVYLKRASQIMPDVTFITGTGQPDPNTWLPTSQIVEDWGSFDFVVAGQNVTFYRGVPVQLASMIETEPFGDAAAEVLFPQISCFEDPSWLKAGNNIDIRHRPPSGSSRVPLFEGLIVSVEDSTDGLRVQCIGALFQLDFWLRQAIIYDRGLVDIGTILATEINPLARDRKSFRCHPLPKVNVGIAVRYQGSWQPSLTGWCQDLLSRAQDTSGQWTIGKAPGRRPTIGRKDRTTQHWTIHVGQHGVTHDLKVDITQGANAIYGEGVDAGNCRWRNAKYPNLRPDDAPVFPGTLMSAGHDYGDDMRTFEQCMHDRGWTDFVIDGVYSSAEEPIVEQFQESAGITVDGVIGPQTWAAAFQVGSGAGDFAASFIEELYADPKVRQFNHDPQGAETTHNPSWDPRVVRVERYENFGSHIGKQEGVLSSRNEVGRDFPTSYFGTMTLTADPNEGSRLDIHAGQNIMVRGHKGVNRLMHIASREIDATQEPIAVQLTLDEKARDFMTLGAMLARDRSTTDRSRRREYYGARTANLVSHRVQDTIPTWDCENGSGIIPRHATYKGLWNVLRIPAGQLGTIVRTEFQTDTPAEFAVGIFDRPLAANDLARIIGPDDPHPEDRGNPLLAGKFWEIFPDSNDPTDTRHGKAPEGLIIAWGDDTLPGGIWPSTDVTIDATVTGKLRENATWYFESQRGTWLWVAIYVGTGPDINYISGRLFASNDF